MFIVIEIQKSESVATLVTAFDSRNEAEAKFHSILAAAAVSTVPLHGAVMMTEEGAFIQNKTYYHELPEEEVISE